MKRLLCIVGGMNAGGAETFLMKIYRSLDRSKYQIDFAVNIKENGFYDDEIRRMGGGIYYFPSKSESFLGYVLGLKKIIQENHYESVLRITSNAMGFLDLAIAKFAGAKKCIARSSNSSDGASFFSRFAHFVGGILFKRFVDVKIAPSTEAALYTFGKKDVASRIVAFLPNGLDLNYYRFDENGRKRIRDEFEIESDCFVIGHAGRFNTQKNHLFLLDVFSQFHKDNPNSKLLLVGDGSLKEHIISKIKEYGMGNSVILAGIRSDMPALYSAMDVFVFPSLYEGMPNTVIEAQACGLKCIISDCITKEADITNNVSYLPIKENSIHVWTNEIAKSMSSSINTCDFPFEYDIKNVVLKFQELVFGLDNA